MKKLILKEKLEYSYLFVDSNNKEIEMTLEFKEIKDLEKGDSIYFPDTIVDNPNFYCFGPIGKKYAKQDNIDENELIKIITKDETIILQRFYG